MQNSEVELKYRFESYAAAQALASLKKVCVDDGHYASNRIYSIYYDTHDWLFAMEKASSDYLKTKVRIRWYQSQSTEQLDTSQITYSKCFFELKRKIGSRRQKVRIPLEIDGSKISEELFSESVKSTLRELISRNAPDLVGHDLQPKIQIHYLRNRFIEKASDARIALDTDICATCVNASFASVVDFVRLPDSVLEVKGQELELPLSLRYIDVPNIKKDTFSKYYQCFELLSGYTQ